MPRPGYKKGGINQRERVSLIAELLLDGALRVMEKSDEKPNEEIISESKPSSQRRPDTNRPSTGMRANPI